MAVKKSTWIGGTAFAGLVMVAGTWLLLVSPTMATASELRAQAQQTRDENELLELKIVKLKADFDKLPEYEAQLAAIQGQIPPEARLTDYLRSLDATAVAHDVTITAIAPAAPQPVAIGGPAAPAADPAATDPASGDAGSTETPAPEEDSAPAPAAPASTVPAGFASIPYSLTVVGTYDNTLAFLWDLQNSVPRLFLVSGLSAVGQGDAEAGGGRPATSVGDLELVITGMTYVMPDPLAVPPAIDPAAPVAPVPPAVPGKNPMVPIAGH